MAVVRDKSKEPGKRMFYLWDENVGFYNSLQNKSNVLNRLLLEAQRGERAVGKDSGDFEGLLPVRPKQPKNQD